MGSPADGRLRVVSWNMGYWQNKAAHEDAWRHLLNELQPDVALLQEARSPESVEPPWRLVERRDERWWSLIVSRGINGEYERPGPESALGRFGTYIAAAELHIAGTPVFVASVHALAQRVEPAWLEGLNADEIGRPDVGEVWHNDLAYYLLRQQADTRPMILGGDWNTCRAYDPPHPTFRGGGAFFSRLQDHGLVDACHHDAGPEAPTRFKGTTEYALDHVIVSSHFERNGAPVIDRSVVPALSDHAPVILDLSLGE
jgi:endonuclease/exonuclease/phosphatase family metal-dependent hydrolase